jgi:4-amino-4-deoxy-L-arabinose transferase-like glycosyltransferase
MLGWCTCVALEIASAPPLTSDEAAYGLMARGAAAWLYRPVGIVAVARLGIAAGGSDRALRLPCAIASPMLLVAVAALGRRFGRWTGAAASAVLAATHTFVLRAPELLDDIPATTCLVWAIVVIVGELERDDGPRYRLVAAAPLCAAAFYLRYGSAPVISLIAVGAIVVWWRTIRARPGPVLVAALALAVLVAPFAMYSARETGSIDGILILAGDASGREFIGQGLRSYLRDNPFRLYGTAITPVLFAGLASIFKPPTNGRRAARFLALTALVQVIALGLISHGSTRFVFLALTLLTVLGVDLFDRVLRWPRLRIGAVVALVLACVVMVACVIPLERRIFTCPLVASG